MAEGIAGATGTPVDAVLTQMRSSPLGRLPSAEEVAACVAFLVSPRAAMITGTSLEIDAGGKRGLA
jgi:3-oxoacyl-[acyl-carrier protein] reductase